MTLNSMNDRVSNPFCTRFIRPGAIPFHFPAGISAGTLIEHLKCQHWTGQIVGPHGTGKSTLLSELQPAILAEGKTPLNWNLRDGRFTNQPQPCFRTTLNSASILIIDGFEQLSVWRRWSLIRTCRLQRCGLLVTTHVSLGLPDLYRTQITPDVTLQVWSFLNRVGASPFTSHDDLMDRLNTRQGNLREALFDLYDLHEQRSQREGLKRTS